MWKKNNNSTILNPDFGLLGKQRESFRKYKQHQAHLNADVTRYAIDRMQEIKEYQVHQSAQVTKQEQAAENS